MFGLGNNGEKTNGNGTHHLIDLSGVVKNYQTPAGPFTALKDVDLRVDTGEFVAVVGKSGSGKSTLVNMITGIDRPSAGQVVIGGTSIEHLNEGKLAAWRGRTVGVIFQFFQLLPTLTVMENVMLPMDFCHLYTTRERKERAMDLLEQVDVAAHAHKLPSAVSGGQQQRVAIARAIANDPPILVADEPTGNLDTKTADAIFALFEGLVAEGKTIVMVTHDRDLARRVSRTVIIQDGEVIEERLAKMFPALTTEQLAQATREITPVRYPAGAVILHEGRARRSSTSYPQPVQAVVRSKRGEEMVAATMGPGQSFGEIELLRGGANMATIRAGLEGVDLAVLDDKAFNAIMAESAESRAEMDRVIRERLNENVAARKEVAMVSPRWRKVIRDLWDHKARTVMVVMSIAVGVFAVGMIMGSNVVMNQGMNGGWAAINPAHATIYTDQFDEGLVNTMRHIEGVADADARRNLSLRFKAGDASVAANDDIPWRNVNLINYLDYDDIHIYKLRSMSGPFPPPDKTVLIERASLAGWASPATPSRWRACTGRCAS
jgi:ABC-type lipoprotein export system ATPase subunit/CRP-like cAMP-binding protein